MNSFLKLASGKAIYEHCGGFEGPGEVIANSLPSTARWTRKFSRQTGRECFRLERGGDGNVCIRTSYFVGVDWVVADDIVIHVRPKFDTTNRETDYFALINTVLEHPQICGHLDGLFEIYPEDPFIEIKHDQDFLTPLIIFRFLALVKEIVRKGLRKTYYTVDQNLKCRVKGKILINETIRQNHFKSHFSNTICQYQMFGFDGYENRLLKKAIQFIRHFHISPNSGIRKWAQPFLNYLTPAFEGVSDEVSISEVKQSRFNPFYQEYREATTLATIILQRLGFTNRTTVGTDCFKIPPYWVDMSRLFELYVLSLLKNSFGSSVQYHFYHAHNELDFLLAEPNYQMVIDSKYKRYDNNSISKDDAWQVSAYARLNKVYEALERNADDLIEALIVYPDPNVQRTTLSKNDLDQKMADPNYRKLFKLAVQLPQCNAPYE